MDLLSSSSAPSKNARNRARKRAKRAAAAAAATADPVAGPKVDADVSTSKDAEAAAAATPVQEAAQTSGEEKAGESAAAAQGEGAAEPIAVVEQNEEASLSTHMPEAPVVDIEKVASQAVTEGEPHQAPDEEATTTPTDSQNAEHEDKGKSSFDPARLQQLTQAKLRPRIVGKRRLGAPRPRPKLKEDDATEAAKHPSTPHSEGEAGGSGRKPADAAGLTAREREEAEMRRRWKRENATMGADIAAPTGADHHAHPQGPRFETSSGAVFSSATAQQQDRHDHPEHEALRRKMHVIHGQGTTVDERHRAESLLQRVLHLTEQAAELRVAHPPIDDTNDAFSRASGRESGQIPMRPQQWQSFFTDQDLEMQPRSRFGRPVHAPQRQERFEEVSSASPGGVEAQREDAEAGGGDGGGDDEPDWYDEAEEGGEYDDEEYFEQEEEGHDGAEDDFDVDASLALPPRSGRATGRYTPHNRVWRRVTGVNAGVIRRHSSASGRDDDGRRGRSTTPRIERSEAWLESQGQYYTVTAAAEATSAGSIRFHPGRTDGSSAINRRDDHARTHPRHSLQHAHTHAQTQARTLATQAQARAYAQAYHRGADLLERRLGGIQLSQPAQAPWSSSYMPAGLVSASMSTASLEARAPSSPQYSLSNHAPGPRAQHAFAPVFANRAVRADLGAFEFGTPGGPAAIGGTKAEKLHPRPASAGAAASFAASGVQDGPGAEASRRGLKRRRREEEVLRPLLPMASQAGAAAPAVAAREPVASVPSVEVVPASEEEEEEEEEDELAAAVDIRTSPTITPATVGQRTPGRRTTGQGVAWHQHGFMTAAQLQAQLKNRIPGVALSTGDDIIAAAADEDEDYEDLDEEDGGDGDDDDDSAVPLATYAVRRQRPRADSPVPDAMGDLVARAMAAQSGRAWEERERRARNGTPFDSAEEGDIEETDRGDDGDEEQEEDEDGDDLFLGSEGEELIRRLGEEHRQSLAAQVQAGQQPLQPGLHDDELDWHGSERMQRTDSAPGELIGQSRRSPFEDDGDEGSQTIEDEYDTAATTTAAFKATTSQQQLNEPSYGRRCSESDTDALRKWCEREGRREQEKLLAEMQMRARLARAPDVYCPVMRQGGGWHYINPETLHAATAPVSAAQGLRHVRAGGRRAADDHVDDDDEDDLDADADDEMGSSPTRPHGVICLPFEQLPFRTQAELDQVLSEGRLTSVGYTVDARGATHDIVAWRITRRELVWLHETRAAAASRGDVGARAAAAGGDDGEPMGARTPAMAEAAQEEAALRRAEEGEGRAPSAQASPQEQARSSQEHSPTRLRPHGLVASSAPEEKDKTGAAGPSTAMRNAAVQTSDKEQDRTNTKGKKAERAAPVAAPAPRCLNCAGRHEHDRSKCVAPHHVGTNRHTAVQRVWDPPDVAHPGNKPDARWNSHLVFRDTGGRVCVLFNGPTPPGCVASRKLRRSKGKGQGAGAAGGEAAAVGAVTGQDAEAGLVCLHGGVHRCSSCGQTGHGMQQCPEVTT